MERKKSKFWPVILGFSSLFLVAGIVVVLWLSGVISLPIGNNQHFESTDEIESYIKEQLDNGVYVIKIDASEKEALTAINRVYDDPMFFWMGRNYVYVSGKKTQVVTFAPAYSSSEIGRMKAEIKKEAENIVSGISKSASDYEKVLYVYEYLSHNVEYVDTDSENDHNAYGALILKKCVCEGYSEAFVLLLDMLGVETYTFTGNAQIKDMKPMPHSWNAAVIDGEVYYYDVTWDSPGISTTGYSHNYCGITSAEIVAEHSTDEYHPLIETKATKYNYQIYNGFYLDECTNEKIAEIIMKQGKEVEIKADNILVYTNLMNILDNPMRLAAVWALTGRDGDYRGACYYNDSTKSAKFIFEYGE